MPCSPAPPGAARAEGSDIMNDAEWALRCDLAATFRIFARLEMNEHIGNHNSVMLPGDTTRFLINPRGLLFQEVTASNLITCDLDGRVLRRPGRAARRRLPHPHPHPSGAAGRALRAARASALPDRACRCWKAAGCELVHHNNLLINDRVAYDDISAGPAQDQHGGRPASPPHWARRQDHPGDGQPRRHRRRPAHPRRLRRIVRGRTHVPLPDDRHAPPA